MIKMNELIPNKKYLYKDLIIFCEHIVTDGGYETNVIYPIGKVDGTELNETEEDEFYFSNDNSSFEEYSEE